MRYRSVRAWLVILSLLAILSAAAAQEDQVGAGLPDVLVLRDGGTRLVGTLVSFDGMSFGFQALGQTLTIPREHVLEIHLSVEDVGALIRPPVSATGAEGDGARTERDRPGGKRVLYVPSGEDVLADDAVRRHLGDEGYDVALQSTAPAVLEGYEAVVIESSAACSEDLAEALRVFIAEGGGCVLTRYTPRVLSGGRTDGGGDGKTSEISEWFGAGQTWRGLWANYNSFANSSHDPTADAMVANPFGRHPDWKAGDVLWKQVGDLYLPCVDPASFAEGAVAIARLTEPREDGWAAFAFCHTFGKGRVYYQALPYGPNSPKLIDLFVSGVQWAGGDVDEVVP